MTADPLPIVIVPIDTLTPHPRNYRGHPEEQLRHLRQSLVEHGWYRNVVAARGDVILAGHGIVQAARQLGLESVPVNRVDLDPDDPRALKILAADNELPRMAVDDPGVLRDLLAEIADVPDVGLLGTGWDELPPVPHQESGHASEPVESDATFTKYPLERLVELVASHYETRGLAGVMVPRVVQPFVAMVQINRLAASDTASLLTTTVGQQIPDQFHPERYETRVGGMNTVREHLENPQKLRVSARRWLQHGISVAPDRIVNALAGGGNVQLPAQFRPGYALALMRRLPKGGRILDTSTGWGGRLVGFAASDLAEYVGIDPSKTTIAGNQRLIEMLEIADRVRLIQAAAEDVDVDDIGPETFDGAATSPPYFAKELYGTANDDTADQSWCRYETYPEWRDGFLLRMLELQFAALKPGALSMVNIADVRMNRSPGREPLPLEADTVNLGRRVGFEHVGTEQMRLPRAPVNADDDVIESEALIVLRKPS